MSGFSARARRAVGAARRSLGSARSERPGYRQWIEAFESPRGAQRPALDAALEAALEAPPSGRRERPRFSVVLPVFDPPVDLLVRAVASVQAQWYSSWELCIADDASSDPEIGRVLALLAADERISVATRTVNANISVASNDALALASGDYVVLLDHDDELAPDALARMALAILEAPGEVGLLYVDEDKVDLDGSRQEPYFKPDFDRFLLLGQNYLSHCTLRRSLVVELGGFRAGFEGAQDWDLVLRAVERLSDDQVVHLPHVLYHWRLHDRSTSTALGVKPAAAAAQLRSVAEHLERAGQPGRVFRQEGFDFLSIDWTRSDPAPPIRRATWSELVAGGVAPEPGDLLVLTAEDIEPLEGDALGALVALASQPTVAVAVPKLLDSRGRIADAGVILGLGGSAGRPFVGCQGHETGYFGNLRLVRRLEAASLDCAVVRADALRAAGGPDRALPGWWAQLDLCLRLGDAGFDVVLDPQVELRRRRSRPSEREASTAFTERWGHRLGRDRSYNPNLSLEAGAAYRLAWPPRLETP